MTALSTDDRTLVVVQPEWNGWRTAVARMIDLEDIHWFQPKGAARPLIHAYVRCTTLQSGDIPHECPSTASPHRLHVCILKRHTAESVFELLSRLATESTQRMIPALGRRPVISGQFAP